MLCSLPTTQSCVRQLDHGSTSKIDKIVSVQQRDSASVTFRTPPHDADGAVLGFRLDSVNDPNRSVCALCALTASSLRRLIISSVISPLSLIHI